MSKRAEAAALTAYPYEKGVKGLVCEQSRGIFIKGYEQAEKDTIERAWEWMTSAKGECTFDDFKKAMEGE